MNTSMKPSPLSTLARTVCSVLHITASSYAIGQAVAWGGMTVAAVTAAATAGSATVAVAAAAVFPAVGAMIAGSIGIYCAAGAARHFGKAVLPWMCIGARAVRQVLSPTSFSSMMRA